MAQLVVIFAALIVSVGTGEAQVLYGSLTGNITDQTGASVPSAKVEALNVSTGVRRQVVTDDRGSYLFNDLQPGTYKVSVSASSFGNVVQDGVTIDANTIRRLDTKLQAAQVSETVTINASALSLQTDRADINQQIQQTQIKQPAGRFDAQFPAAL